MSESSWTSTAFATLEERGYRVGGARTAVIELLGEEGGCLDADHVAGRLKESKRKVATASVYRALGLLTDLGLLQKVALPSAPNRFELVRPDGEHHHHIVCDRCGETAAFSDDVLEDAIHAVAERSSFKVEAHEITLHGCCRKCCAS